MTALEEVRPVKAVERRGSHLWARDPNDWYVEPQWVSRRLFEVERFEGAIWDPACGMGRIIQSAQEVIAGHDLQVLWSDIVSRCPGTIEQDFLDADRGPIAGCNNIVSNPPYSKARRFADLAIKRAHRKVALLLPTRWVQGDERSRWLETTPLYRVYFLSPRPSMPPGAVVMAGEKPGGGKVDFAWYVWLKGFTGSPTIHWLRKDP